MAFKYHLKKWVNKYFVDIEKIMHESDSMCLLLCYLSQLLFLKAWNNVIVIQWNGGI